MDFDTRLSSISQETRDEIYRSGLTGKDSGKGEHDIDIFVKTDGKSIQCPALDYIDELARNNNRQLDEVRNLLFSGSRFRYVIKDTSWPPSWPFDQLLQRLRQHPSGPESVRKLYIERFTIHGLDLGDLKEADRDAEARLGHIPISADVGQSPFLTHRQSENKSGPLRTTLQLGLMRTVHLLRDNLPNLEQLDLGLDIVECFPWTQDPQGWSLMEAINEYDLKGWGFDGVSSMGFLLRALRLRNNIGSLNIRICWGDFFRPNRKFNVQLSDAQIRGYEDDFLKAFQSMVPAKSITHYRGSE
ncbi:hypothetical protein K491DRAFT_683180 [Lophiostoma macrostomum CBS 122681]|uniref:Uncharacterized protein n=1 Tax=Lophiostoma macrostomum CBS 122681 TaxID=1314788 RepID=A0A6A6SQS2_9PLEO|nr:hypothetical protein K491DRAFT_683180 [Lophiostoma macrostomum CBS 122681]